jgi:hypothetical protein
MNRTVVRRAARVVLLLLALCACSRAVTVSPEPGTSSSPRAGGTPGGTVSSGGSGRTSAGASSGSTATTVPAASYDDHGPVGSMAKTFLRASPARKLIVEVDWVQGREPSGVALDHLESVLQSVVRKPDGVVVERGAAMASARNEYTVQDIRAMEAAHRTRHSGGAVATMWFAFLNGSFAQNTDALGVSYEASAAAIFGDRIDAATTAVLLASEIERSVVTHEAGHLLALLNIGYHSAFDHEDAEHPHHSKSKDSVMYWAVEDISIRSILGGGPPSDFDDADRADLRSLGGK